MKKISTVLLEYARPIMRLVNEQPDRAQLQQILRLAVTIWNAVVLEQSGHVGRYLEQARTAVHESALPIAAGLFDSLVEHKYQSFADDRRLVLDFEVIESPDGRLGIQVEAGEADLPVVQ